MSNLKIWLLSIYRHLFEKEQLASQLYENQRIPFDFIAEKLRKSARASRDIIGNVIVVPNKYIIRFSPEDRAFRKQFEQILIKELQIALEKELRKWRAVESGVKSSIIIETDTALDLGNFYIECHFLPQSNPDAKRKKAILYSSKRHDISKTTIPPSSSPESQIGSLVRTLLNSENLSQSSDREDYLMCNIKVIEAAGEKAYYVPEGKYSAGRGKAADIQISKEDFKVSRKHLEFIVGKSGMTVKMLGRNGGMFNNEFIGSGVECFMNSGDSITIGKADITIHLEKMDGSKNDCHSN